MQLIQSKNQKARREGGGINQAKKLVFLFLTNPFENVKVNQCLNTNLFHREWGIAPSLACTTPFHVISIKALTLCCLKWLLAYLLQCGLFRCQDMWYTSAETAPAHCQYSMYIPEKMLKTMKCVEHFL